MISLFLLQRTASRSQLQCGHPAMQSHPRISNCLGVLENLPQEFTFSTTSKSERSRIHTFLGHRSLANKATVRLHRCMAKHGRAHRHRSFYHEGLWPWCRITSKVPVQVEWAMALMYGKTQKHSRKWQNALSTESHLLYLHPSPTIITGHNTMIHSCKNICYGFMHFGLRICL